MLDEHTAAFAPSSASKQGYALVTPVPAIALAAAAASAVAAYWTTHTSANAPSSAFMQEYSPLNARPRQLLLLLLRLLP
jgi:hypothetical protein